VAVPHSPAGVNQFAAIEPNFASRRTIGVLPDYGATKGAEMDKLNRRSFLKTAGVATGAMAATASPAVAAAIEPGAVETTPTGKVPHEAVIAIVRNADLSEVTVLSGTTEKTYKDRALVKRLLKAAQSNHRSAHGTDGVA
jgi:hypothetical protein